MARQYLDVPYRAKDAAKALGARFDGGVKRWYVEDGIELGVFQAWLPTELALAPGGDGTVTDMGSPNPTWRPFGEAYPFRGS